MQQLMQHTPIWAFLLLGLMIWRGASARYDRVLSIRATLTLPILMLLWSVWRLLTAPHQEVAALLAWFAAAALAFMACRKLDYPRGLLLDASAENIYVPGSWLTLGLMLLLYTAHFVTEMNLAMQHWSNSAAYAAGCALVYGGVSGLFFARVFAVWQLLAARRALQGRS